LFLPSKPHRACDKLCGEYGSGDPDHLAEELLCGNLEMNLDLIRWPVYNSHRKDIVWDYSPEEMGCPPQLKYPVEYDARVLVHYDGNQFVCDSGAEEFIEINSKTVNRTSTLPGTTATGMRAQQPYIYLLPYWMARYHGLIGD